MVGRLVNLGLEHVVEFPLTKETIDLVDREVTEVGLTSVEISSVKFDHCRSANKFKRPNLRSNNRIEN